MNYQIYYKNEEEFDKLEKLLLDNREYNCSKRYVNCAYVRLVPTRYNWYIITENLDFVGMNGDKIPQYKSITIEELEELYKKEKCMSKPTFNDKVYHFYIKDNIHREFAIALLEKYNFKWWTTSSLRKCIEEKNLPIYLVIEDDLNVDWNSEDEKDCHSIVSLNDFESLLEYFSKNNAIKIDGMKVIFNDDKSISVGCKTISFETINKIWTKLNNIQ